MSRRHTPKHGSWLNIAERTGDDSRQRLINARNAMKAELQNIAAEAIKPGTKLNRLLAP